MNKRIREKEGKEKINKKISIILCFRYKNFAAKLANEDRTNGESGQIVA